MMNSLIFMAVLQSTTTTGNSLGRIRAKDIRSQLKPKEGDKVQNVEQTERGIKPSPYDPKHAKAMEIARRSFSTYADTYKALAK